MARLQWTPEVDAWAANLSNDVFDDVEILVRTDGEDDPPTAKQLEAVSLIERISQEDLAKIAGLVRKFAAENFDEEELDEMDEEDFEYEITSATVPRLRDATNVYFILCGSSELDPEHGLGCICKNGKQFAICHPDYAYENYDWDSVDELDALIG